MLEFKKYNSIENTYNKDLIGKIKLEELDFVQYVVQEKVHGANCCFITNGQSVSFAKRTSIVEPNELFYNYEELLERYKEKIIKLFYNLKEKYTNIESILVYGEMFGGKYPHPEVKNDSKTMCIQKGVFYCSEHEFYGFDIYVREMENNRYLPVDEINSLFEAEGFYFAKTLLQGTLDECLAYPNAFQSLVPQLFGLPEIEDNICEGVVIRPIEPLYFRNGSRVLLKNKNAKFAEKKSVKKREGTAHIEPTYSEELNNLLLIVEEYVTENRLNNVVSKIGEISIPKELGKLMGFLSKDVLEDFLKEHSATYNALEKTEQKALNRFVNNQSTKLIKKVYMTM